MTFGRVTSIAARRWFNVLSMAIVLAIVAVVVYCIAFRTPQRVVEIVFLPDQGTGITLLSTRTSVYPDRQGVASVDLVGIVDDTSISEVTLSIYRQSDSALKKPLSSVTYQVSGQVLYGSYQLGSDASLLTDNRKYLYRLVDDRTLTVGSGKINATATAAADPDRYIRIPAAILGVLASLAELLKFAAWLSDRRRTAGQKATSPIDS